MVENIEEIHIKQEMNIEVTEVISPISQVKEEVDIEEHDILLDPQLLDVFPDVDDLKKKLFILSDEVPQIKSPLTKDPTTNKNLKQIKEQNEEWLSSKVVLKDCGETLQSSGNLCQECGVQFLSCNAFKKHRCGTNQANKIMKTYTKPKSDKLKRFECNLCPYTCSKNNYLILHHRTHTKEKPFKCNFCNYESTQKPYLIRHMVTHTNERLYCCNLCDYKGADSTSLKKHTRTHNKDKKDKDKDRHFKCNLCDYRALQSGRLKEHMGIHDKEKKFKCDLCEYRSNFKSYLKVHRINVHTKEKPFECIICKYRCSQSSTLKRHMRRHTQEKPFKCDLCEYRGARSCSVKYHMKTHHRVFHSN